ncbi:MAG: hypothetical protein ACOYXT_02585 [Bacteroidota bacterium]
MLTKKLHYHTGLTLSVFITLHLFNHLSSIIGVETHLELMETLRLIYRNVIVETILLLTVIFQIISGVSLFRAKRKAALFGFDKLHIWSGLYLAFFLVAHVSAVFVGRFLLHVDTNFYFGAAGLNDFPSGLFFYPYYGLAVLAVFAHFASVHYKKMEYNVAGLTPYRQAQAILITGAIMTLTIFYGLTNGFRGITMP